MCDRCRGRVGGAFDRADAAAVAVHAQGGVIATAVRRDLVRADDLDRGCPPDRLIQVPSSSAERVRPRRRNAERRQPLARWPS
jgi:hypothetical protein